MIAISSSFALNAPRADEHARLASAATKFEAIFARQMLASARKASLSDDLFGGEGMQTFRQMLDEHFADLLAQSGTLGLGKAIAVQLADRIGNGPVPGTGVSNAAGSKG